MVTLLTPRLIAASAVLQCEKWVIRYLLEVKKSKTKPLLYSKIRSAYFLKLDEGCVFFVLFCFVGFFELEGVLMMELQSQQQTRTFVVCQIKKVIALFVNISRSVNNPREARSGRASYVKGDSSKVVTTIQYWFVDFSLIDRKLLINNRYSTNLLINMLIQKINRTRDFQLIKGHFDF